MSVYRFSHVVTGELVGFNHMMTKLVSFSEDEQLKDVFYIDEQMFQQYVYPVGPIIL